MISIGLIDLDTARRIRDRYQLLRPLTGKPSYFQDLETLRDAINDILGPLDLSHENLCDRCQAGDEGSLGRDLFAR